MDANALRIEIARRLEAAETLWVTPAVRETLGRLIERLVKINESDVRVADLADGKGDVGVRREHVEILIARQIVRRGAGQRLHLADRWIKLNPRFR